MRADDLRFRARLQTPLWRRADGYNALCMKTVAESGKARWQHETLEPALKKSPERAATFTTISGRPIDRLYTAEDVEGIDYERDINNPGVFPYTRGIHPTGYRGKLWTMRQFAGFGTPEDTNERYKTLLQAGGTGLSVAFDLPTLMGRDPDHELSLGEVGKCGVSIMSLADMETLFDGIQLGDITTSMTINSPAAMIFAMYLVVAEKQGADWKKISGTIQNDILKEFIAQKEYIFPPRPSMRLITDIFAFCATQVPKWNTISVSGYHIREAGATAVQELAFTLRDGLEYVQWGVDAGLDVDAFVPQISFFFNAHSDFFEEIAKYRAARKIWAEAMRDRFRRQERAVVEAALPQPDRRRLAHRAAALQQRRAHRAAGAVGGARRHQLAAHQLARRGAGAADRRSRDAGAADAADHRARERRRQRRRSARRIVLRREADQGHGGRRARLLRGRSTRMGGMVEAIERGFPQQEIAESSYRFQQAFERKEKIMVGVNASCSRTIRRSKSSTSTSRRPTRSSPSSRRCARRAISDAVTRVARRAARRRAARPRT